MPERWILLKKALLTFSGSYPGITKPIIPAAWEKRLLSAIFCIAGEPGMFHLIIPLWLNWMIWHALSGCWMAVMFLIFVNLTVPVLVILYAVKTISGSCTKGNILRSVPSLKERFTSCSDVRIWLTG